MVWIVSRTDEETRISSDCIILFVHANPDGNDLVADWYAQQRAGQRSLANLPRATRNYRSRNRDFASTSRDKEHPAVSITSGSTRFSTTTTRAVGRHHRVVVRSPIT